MRMSRSKVTSLLIAFTLGAAMPAFAGPPLLCHPYDIGDAKTLPWGSGWMNEAPGYDLNLLIGDTEALLTPATPVIVRMETLRRASLYASRDPKIAAALVDRMSARAAHGDPLALVDAAYTGEALREAALVNHQDAIAAIAKAVDPWSLVDKSIAARPDDAAFQFAAAMIYAAKDRTTSQAHAEKARLGAKSDALLARNLDHLN